MSFQFLPLFSKTVSYKRLEFVPKLLEQILSLKSEPILGGVLSSREG